MTSEQWQSVKDLFEEALERAPIDRSAFLAKACVDDDLVRQEVESLLIAHENDAAFMNEPVGNLIPNEKPILTTGQRFGHYKEISLLGEGGMGQVYLAVDSRLGRKVALKLLPTSYKDNPDRALRLEQEARAASALNHPNIVTIHEIGETDSVQFMATEFVEGETLRVHMTNARMTVGEVLDVAVQAASALQAAHDAGIIHRDIKPENIMLRRDHVVKVLDFGLAKLTTPSFSSVDAHQSQLTVRTNPGMIMGTVGYMSPQQARGEKVDARTDVWSLGVVLYEMVAGHMPFTGDTPSHVIVSILEKEPPALSVDTHVTAELSRIIAKSLSKEADKRYQTAGDVALDLRNLKEELTIEARLKQFPRTNVKGFETGASTDVHRASAQFSSTTTAFSKSIVRHKGWIAFASLIVVLSLALPIYLVTSNKVTGEPIDSVAVLPFINEGGESDSEYLAEGISEAVIDRLSRLTKLRVISFNGVIGYKGKQVDPKQIGQELNVKAVLVGRLTRSGNALAISTELVDTSDYSRLWGEQYRRQVLDIQAIETEIAHEISAGLRLRLTGEEEKRLSTQSTANPEAYRLYSLGRFYHRKNTKEDFEKGIKSYEQAIEIDPAFTLAYVWLARAYHWMGSRGFWPSKESAQKTELYALKALQLDDSLAEAHAYLGVSKYNDFDWRAAEKALKRALELDPNSVMANRTYSQYLAARGRTDEAIQYALRATALDPDWDVGGAALFYFFARQYDKAVESYKKGLEKEPEAAGSYILLGEAYLAQGLVEAGIAQIKKGISVDKSLAKTPERWDRYPMLAYAYALGGQRQEALKILNQQKELAKQRFVSPYNFAIIYTGLGDKDQAFTWLAKCIDERARQVFRLKVRPMFDPLRSDPRYAELLRRMNLEP